MSQTATCANCTRPIRLIVAHGYPGSWWEHMDNGSRWCGSPPMATPAPGSINQLPDGPFTTAHSSGWSA